MRMVIFHGEQKETTKLSRCEFSSGTLLCVFLYWELVASLISRPRSHQIRKRGF